MLLFPSAFVRFYSNYPALALDSLHPVAARHLGTLVLGQRYSYKSPQSTKKKRAVI